MSKDHEQHAQALKDAAKDPVAWFALCVEAVEEGRWGDFFNIYKPQLNRCGWVVNPTNAKRRELVEMSEKEESK